MSIRTIIKRSITLICVYYIINDWYSRCRLLVGNLKTSSGTRHANFTTEESLAYIDRVYNDYLCYAGLNYFTGEIAEIGPGDNFGVALRILGGGASQVHAIDRWISNRKLDSQQEIYKALSDHYDLNKLFLGETTEKNIKNLTYHSGKSAEAFFKETTIQFDSIISRAVMEHLYDPITALDYMLQSLKTRGIMIHRVDLRDHGMFPHHHPLTLLTFSDSRHRNMTQGSGRPNRVPISDYRKWLQRTGMPGELKITRLVGNSGDFPPTEWSDLNSKSKSAALTYVRKIKPALSKRFKHLPDEDLAVAGFVIVLKKL